MFTVQTSMTADRERHEDTMIPIHPHMWLVKKGNPDEEVQSKLAKESLVIKSGNCNFALRARMC